MFKENNNINAFKAGLYDLANNSEAGDLIDPDSLIIKELINCTKKLLKTLRSYRPLKNENVNHNDAELKDILADQTYEEYFKLIEFGENINAVQRILIILRNCKTSQDLKNHLDDINSLLDKSQAIALALETNQLKPLANKGQKFNQSRKPGAFSHLHKYLQNVYAQESQVSDTYTFKDFLKSLKKIVIENKDKKNEILQSIEDDELTYRINGEEKTIGLNSLKAKISEYKKRIARPIA